MDEYAFRFPLSDEAASGASLAELIEGHLRELLSILVPTWQGEDVRIDGFRFLNDPDKIQSLDHLGDGEAAATFDPLELYEPRIPYIRRLLESLLPFIEFEAGGESVQIDGFHLRDLSHWLSPGGGASDILAHAATRCNLRCRFCYNRAAPKALRPEPRKPEDEYHEIKTRIASYVPGAKLNLFPSMGSPCEALAHPFIVDILSDLRRKTDETLRIPTNGSTLTTQIVDTLESLKPVYLDISLNSAAPERRRWLMGDPLPQVALDALGQLRSRGIPYSVVIVPWPFPSDSIMLDDLRETIAFASSHTPTLIQISLPGYSRSFSEEELFSHDTVWNELKAAVLELRCKTDCPIVLRPGLFEEYLDPDAVNEPRVVGLIVNSPAVRAGVHPGDRLLKVNGLPVKNRPQARSLLAILHRSDLDMASLTVQRNGAQIDLSVNVLEFDYPYTRETSSHLGVIFPSSGVPEVWRETLCRVIEEREAREVLLLTSALVRPTLERYIRKNGLHSHTNVHLRVPRNRYFGGNIFMGDLLVVQDFIDEVEAYLNEGGGQPDLLVIPSSPFHLSRWGRDLTGRLYLDIENRTGIPVALVDCEPIFD
jgi:sulfatase maturation enzyme AslB (radical SAM superfamily)